jgi:hypothetical protein
MCARPSLAKASRDATASKSPIRRLTDEKAACDLVASLDRTSLRLAHSLDHLVSERER